jgi:hypothetical protein
VTFRPKKAALAALKDTIHGFATIASTAVLAPAFLCPYGVAALLGVSTF